ncbi:tripartite tricarboxylate transporter substrate binding protein [Devosia sp. A369]
MVVSFVLVATFATAVSAQDSQPAVGGWVPTEAVTIVTHSAAGGGNDLIAREIISIIAREDLAPVDFEIVNMSGGGSTLAVQHIESQAGNEYMLGLGSNSWITDNLMYEEARYGMQDLTPVALLVEDPFVLLVAADSPYQTLTDFVEAAIENKGGMSGSSGALYSREHLISNAIMDLTGAEWNVVVFPSRGERTAALLGGHINIHATDAGEALELVRSGRARALAVMSPVRLEGFPDVPMVQEVYDIPHLSLVRIVMAPPAIPDEVLSYYGDLIKRVTETEAWTTYASDNGFVAAFLGPDEAGAFLEEHKENIREFSVSAGATLVR